jgi:hypothetical protein
MTLAATVGLRLNGVHCWNSLPLAPTAIFFAVCCKVHSIGLIFSSLPKSMA